MTRATCLFEKNCGRSMKYGKSASCKMYCSTLTFKLFFVYLCHTKNIKRWWLLLLPPPLAKKFMTLLYDKGIHISTLLSLLVLVMGQVSDRAGSGQFFSPWVGFCSGFWIFFSVQKKNFLGYLRVQFGYTTHHYSIIMLPSLNIGPDHLNPHTVWPRLVWPHLVLTSV